jgi:hypothetical protein
LTIRSISITFPAMIRKLFLAISLVAIVAELAIASNDYIWPMKLTPELTSKFCDYRAGHFHGGLDLRTGGRIGVPIYAISDGYVWRVVTSFRGYGKALYIKLKDDRIIVFGHLSNYFEALDGRIWAAQLKDKKYGQDLYFTSSEFPVKKGQLIAYSGESGTGAPHLHFEMRSPLNNPINPLESGYSMTDKIPPEFDYLAVRYYTSKFNPGNPCEIEFLSATKNKIGKGYSIPDTIISNDNLALAVAGGDRIGGSGFFYGYYELRLLCDDSLLFQMKSDSLSYNTTRQLNYVRDLELIRLFARKNKTDNDLGIFYRLYVPPRSNQYFWPGLTDDSGIILPNDKPGTVRKITIEALDEAGNKSELRFYLKTPDFPSITLPSYSRNRDTVTVEFPSPEMIKSAIVESRGNISQAYKPIKSSFTCRPMSDGGYNTTLRLNTALGDSEYRFIIFDSQKRCTPWTNFHDAAPDEGFKLVGSPQFLRVQFPSRNSSLQLEITTSGQQLDLEMIPDGPNVVKADIFDKSSSGPARFIIRAGSAIVFDTSLVLYGVAPGNACEIQSPDSTLTISFQENSAYYPAYVFPSKGVKTSTAAGPGIVYNIQPDVFLADTPLKLSFDVAKLGIAGKMIGAYGYSSGTGGWNFIGKINGDRLEANAFGLGKLALLEDNDPPKISSVSPSGISKTRTPLISCTVGDRISGLALDSGLNMTIDGVWVPAEYDIDGSRFSYKVKSPLKAGKHTVEIKALDNQGNSTTKVTEFSVSAK